MQHYCMWRQYSAVNASVMSGKMASGTHDDRAKVKSKHCNNIKYPLTAAIAMRRLTAVLSKWMKARRILIVRSRTYSFRM